MAPFPDGQELETLGTVAELGELPIQEELVQVALRPDGRLQADPLRLSEQDGPQLMLVPRVAEVEGRVAGRQPDVAVVLLYLTQQARLGLARSQQEQLRALPRRKI